MGSRWVMEQSTQTEGEKSECKVLSGTYVDPILTDENTCIAVYLSILGTIYIHITKEVGKEIPSDHSAG
jgi:hypothetical protein